MHWTKLLFAITFIGIGLVITPSASATDIDKIAKANEYKEKAEKAQSAQQYEQAIQHYHYLLDSMGIDEPELTLNLAHCYYRNGDTDQASTYYQQLAAENDKEIKSVASQQLGVMQAKKKEYDAALSHLKKALKANPANAEARYNYEIVKRLAEEQKEKEKQEQEDKKQNKEEQQEEKQQQQDQQQKDQQEQEQEKQQQDQNQKEQQQKDQQKEQQQEKSDQQKKSEQQQQEQEQKKQEEQEKKDQQAQPSEEEREKEEKKKRQQQQQQRLQQINMSKEKAQMILEALKNQEVQYYQQMRRKAQPKENGKPDW